MTVFGCRPSGCRDAGFTLMELIVSIVIMVLLMALLLPALRHARQAAAASACGNHLRQNAMAAWVYANAHNGQFPPLVLEIDALPPLPDQAADRAFEVRIRARSMRASGLKVFEEEKLVCPSDDERPTIPVRRGEGPPEDLPFSYGYNAVLLRDRVTYEQAESSDQAIFFDGHLSGGSDVPEQGVQGQHQGGQAFAERASIARHAGQINVLFADQRVKRYDEVQDWMAIGR